MIAFGRAAVALMLSAGLFAAGAARADPGLAAEVEALRGELAAAQAQLAQAAARLEVLGRAVSAPCVAPDGAQAAVALAAVPAAAAVAPAPAPAAAPAPKPAPAVAPDAAEARRLAWRQLKEGQSESDVETLLGPPTRRFELSGKWVRYYYYHGVGAGSVFFDSTFRISSVQRPPG